MAPASRGPLYQLMSLLILDMAATVVVIVGLATARIIVILAGFGLCCIVAILFIAMLLGQRQSGVSTNAGGSMTANLMPGVLYADRLVRLTEDDITFFKYSVPFLRDERVPYTEIDHISSREPTLTTGKWRIWGSSNLSTWFPFDWDRPSRDTIFLATLKGTTRKIGFTVEDSARVTAILRKKGLLADDR